MLEQLGLGVVLSLEDNFSEASNNALASFERLQNGAQSMVENVQKQMLNMRNIMMTGFTFKEMGESVEQFGQKVTGVFEKMLKGIEDSSSKWETMKRTLHTFYGDATDGVMAKGLDLASKTPFNADEVMDAVRSLKASGLDALKTYDAVDQAGRHYKKTFLEYVGDVGAFNPEQGIQGAMYALRNLLGGQKKSLDTRFDVNSELKLGESWSDDPAKIQEQFVKFATNLAPNMMHNLEGTAQQLISNLQDNWEQFVIKVGDSGAFDPMKNTLVWISEKIDELKSNGKFDAFAKTIGTAIADLWKPIDMIIKGLFTIGEKLAEFMSYHPILAKFVVGFTAIAGAVLTLTGFIMKMAGSFLLAVSSISMLIMNMQLMKLQGISLMGAFSGLSGVLSSAVSWMGILALAGTGMFIAWQNDIAGVRTRLSEFFSSISTGWSTAYKMMSDQNLRKAIMGGASSQELGMRFNIKLPPLASIFAKKFAKVLAVVKLFWTVFTGTFNNGVMRFSKKDWDLYKDMGIEPLAKGLVFAKEKVDLFFKGFGEGLSVVAGFAEQLIRTVWAPIDFILDEVEKYTKAHPDGILGVFMGDDGGVNIDTANAMAEQMQKLGRAVGIVVGALVSFKIIKTLTPILTSPFKKMYQWLEKVGRKAESVKKTLSNFSIKSALANTSNKLFGGQITQTGIRVANRINRDDRTTKGSLRRDGKFNTLSRKNVDSTYYDYFLNDKLKGRELQTRRRSKLGRLMFGETYYAKNVDGSREKLGKFGGLFHMGRDDKNIQNNVTKTFSDSQVPLPRTKDDFNHRVIPGDTLGRLRDLKGYSNGRVQELQDDLHSSAKSVKGLAGSRFDRFASVRNKEVQRDYQNLSDTVKRGGSLDAGSMRRLSLYSGTGATPSNMDAITSNPSIMRQVNGQLRANYTNRALQNDSLYQKQLAQVRGAQSGNQAIFADPKQNRLSRAVFGQKVYTVNDDGKGNFKREYVARKGGLLNRNSMSYRPGQSTLRDRIANSALVTPITDRARALRQSVSRTSLGRGVSGARAKIGSTASRLTGLAGLGYNRLANSRVGRGVSSVAGAGASRLRRAGFNVPKMPTSFRGAVGMAGRGAISLGKGAVGMAGRAGSMALHGAGMLGRGVGAVGGLAMRAMPWVMAGSMAYRGVSNLAKNKVKTAEDRKKYGINKGDNNFNQGLKVLKTSLKGLDVNKIWSDFKKQGSTALKSIVGIAKDAWSKLKPMLPQIMNEAWTACKALAKSAWEWIKTDGVTLLGQLAKQAMQLIGKAWEWIKTEGASKFGELVGDALVWLAKLGAHIIQNIPEYISQAIELGKNIIHGLWDFCVSVFKGIGATIKDAVIGAIEGLGSAVSGALGSIVRSVPGIGNDVADFLGLPAHHGGLWMNDTEHLAIVRKDETVLPPDISTQLKDNLMVNRGGKRGGTVTSGRSIPTVQGGDTFTVDKVEIIMEVKNGTMTREEARANATLIRQELKRQKRNKKIRNYQDIDGTEDIL